MITNNNMTMYSTLINWIYKIFFKSFCCNKINIFTTIKNITKMNNCFNFMLVNIRKKLFSIKLCYASSKYRTITPTPPMSIGNQSYFHVSSSIKASSFDLRFFCFFFKTVCSKFSTNSFICSFSKYA